MPYRVPVDEKPVPVPAIIGGHCQTDSTVTCRQITALEATGTAASGYTVYAGGVIDVVRDTANGGGDYSGFSNLIRFNSQTGALDRNYAPQFYNILGTLQSARVESILVDLPGNAIYVSGKFNRFKQSATSPELVRVGLVKLNLSTGLVDETFNANLCSLTNTTCVVNAMVMTGTGAGRKLIIGGRFSQVNGVAKSGFALLNPKTGALVNTKMQVVFADPIIPVTVANTMPVGVPIHIQNLALSPDKRKLVVTGNFSTVGTDRPYARQTNVEVAVFNMDPLLGQPTSLSTWNSNYLHQSRPISLGGSCLDTSTFPSHAVWAPDNSKFYLVSWRAGWFDLPVMPLCDSVSVWANESTPNAVPLVINRTERDTLLSGCLMDDVFYVGGHQRSFNYELLINGVRQSTTPTTHYGIGALDMQAGSTNYARAIPTWNDGTATGRGHGWTAALCLPDTRGQGGGVYFGGDAEQVNGDWSVRRLTRFPAVN